MQKLAFFILKAFFKALSLLGFKGLYVLAYLLHPLFYFAISKYRKRALSNLKLAKELNLSDNDIRKTARLSLFHLLLTALEYGKLASIKRIDSFCKNLNSEETDHLLNNKQGVIFFCGHQSNWELLFLDATSRHPGVCIGKPQKNKDLYEFVLKIREKFMGKVITPKDAYKGCIKALRQGHLVGVVGDQGMPDSPFEYDCLGRTAHMTTLPALLSLRSKAPLYVATIVRYFGRYEITYSGPIDSRLDDVSLVTQESLKLLDSAIRKHPEQYMWQHNRWKIAYEAFIPKKYRHDAIAVILNSATQIDDLSQIRNLYKGAYIIVFKPDTFHLPFKADEIIDYKDENELFITHYGPKLIFDLVGIKGLKKHFMKQSVFEYIYTHSIKDLIDSWKLSYAY